MNSLWRRYFAREADPVMDAGFGRRLCRGGVYCRVKDQSITYVCVSTFAPTAGKARWSYIFRLLSEGFTFVVQCGMTPSQAKMDAIRYYG